MALDQKIIRDQKYNVYLKQRFTEHWNKQIEKDTSQKEKQQFCIKVKFKVKKFHEKQSHQMIVKRIRIHKIIHIFKIHKS